MTELPRGLRIAATWLDQIRAATGVEPDRATIDRVTGRAFWDRPCPESCALPWSSLAAPEYGSRSMPRTKMNDRKTKGGYPSADIPVSELGPFPEVLTRPAFDSPAHAAKTVQADPDEQDDAFTASLYIEHERVREAALSFLPGRPELWHAVESLGRRDAARQREAETRTSSTSRNRPGNARRAVGLATGGLDVAEHRPEEPAVDTTPEQSVMTSPLTDVRDAPLAKAEAPETLARLRPAGKGIVPVAAFNSSL